MKVLQMLYCLSKTPTRNINFRSEVRCLFISKYQLATKAETPKGNLPPQKIRSPRKWLTPVLKQELELNSSEVHQFFRKGALVALDKYLLRERLENLREMGYTDEEIKSEMSVLFLPKNEVHLRRAILEECGFRHVTISHLSRFEVLKRRRIGVLKDIGYIPSNLNVPKNILSYSDKNLPLPNLRALRKERGLPASTTAEALPLEDLHKFLVLHYIAHYLEDPNILKKRRLFQLNSIRKVIAAYEALENFDVSKKQLRMFLQLSQCDLENVEDLLRCYPMIGRVRLERIIKKNPNVVLCTPSDIAAVLRCMNNFGFSEKTIAAYPAILTINVNILEQGLPLLQCVPDLWALRHCEDIFRLLCQKSLILKLHYFQSLPNKVIPTVTLLGSGNAAISKALQRNSARTPVFNFLRFLSVELNTDVSKVKRILSLHPHWRLGSAGEMLETLTLIRAYGFTNQHILDNLQILLYSRSYVQSVLEKNLYPLSPDGKVKKTPSKTDLALCLYYIEREHQFTGMGINKGPRNVSIGGESTRLSFRCRGRPCRQDCWTNPWCSLRIETNQSLVQKQKEG